MKLCVEPLICVHKLEDNFKACSIKDILELYDGIFTMRGTLSLYTTRNWFHRNG